MEKKHIDNIAGVVKPERSEGSQIPEVSEAEPLTLEKSSSDLPSSGVSGAEPLRSNHNISLSNFYIRNEILSEWGLEEVTSPERYFEILFSRPDPDTGEMVSYLQASGPAFYRDRHYNAVAYDLRSRKKLDRKTGEEIEITQAKKYDITRDLSECAYLKSPDAKTVISCPVLYAGKTRSAERARSVWGIAIDLDDVKPSNLNDLILWVDKLDFTPMPSMIVSSGGGLHLYYLFPMGIKCYPHTVKLLQRLKHNMTDRLWTPYFSSNPHPQMGQGIWQGFRIPGTPTKYGDKVVGFVPEQIPYYTAKELNRWFYPQMEEFIDRDNKPLTDEEAEALDNNGYIPSKISRQEAEIKWPDWDPDKKEKGRYVCHRRLYESWLERLKNHDKDVKVGHRYSCIMALVTFAKKCNVPFEEVEKDAYSLVDWLDSKTKEPTNHFTRSDVADALKLYHQESTVRFRRRYLEFQTGIDFHREKRNGRTREQNLIIARTARDVNDSIRGMKWDTGNGRKEAKIEVQRWCLYHPYVAVKTVCAKELGLDNHTVAKWWWKENPKTIPEAILKWKAEHPGNENKSQCAKDCAVSRPTVIKWWNCTFEDAKAEYERITALAEAGREAASKVTSQLSEEPHDLGANVNSDYITSKKVAAATMQHTDGYEKHSVETINSTHDELSDAINFGALNIEKMMKAMGVPEFLIPMMKAEFEKQMQTPEFWEKYKKTNPKVDMSKWPPQVREAYEEAIEEHNKKK